MTKDEALFKAVNNVAERYRFTLSETGRQCLCREIHEVVADALAAKKAECERLREVLKAARPCVSFVIRESHSGRDVQESEKLRDRIDAALKEGT